MTLDQAILVGLVVLFGAALQASVGFGFGLFAIPLLVWVGLPLPTAVAIAVSATLAQTVWTCWQYREHIAWRSVWPISLLRLATLPVGVLLLGVLAGAGQARIKQVVGAIVLGAILLQWLAKVKPRERVHHGWTVAAGGSSGVLTGLVDMGGPPMVLWIMAHDWPAPKARSFFWASMLLLAPLHLALLAWRFGPEPVVAAGIGLAYTPVVLLGSVVGLEAGALLSRQRLRVAVMSLLVLIALSSVLSPLLGLSAAQ